MDLSLIIQSRQNRSERVKRPFNNFYDSFAQCAKASNLILEGVLDDEVKQLLERSAVITTVSSIEVYYKDILAILFKMCKPSFFEPHLKYLHSEKFDIADLIDFYKHDVHPLDIVLAAQSFQNIERIDKVFGKFLPKGGLWASVIGMQLRRKEEPEKITEFTEDSLVKLKKLFELRHQLVHDPVRRSFYDESTHDWIYCSAHMVMGSDVVLGRIISENIDPTIKETSQI